MITDLNALKLYTVRRAELTPRLKHRVVLQSPGCDSASIIKLTAALPNIPISYLKCAQALNLNGISLGYFQLTPHGSPRHGFVEALIHVNSPGHNPFWKL